MQKEKLIDHPSKSNCNSLSTQRARNLLVINRLFSAMRTRFITPFFLLLILRSSKFPLYVDESENRGDLIDKKRHCVVTVRAGVGDALGTGASAGRDGQGMSDCRRGTVRKGGETWKKEIGWQSPLLVFSRSSSMYFWYSCEALLFCVL